MATFVQNVWMVLKRISFAIGSMNFSFVLPSMEKMQFYSANFIKNILFLVISKNAYPISRCGMVTDTLHMDKTLRFGKIIYSLYKLLSQLGVESKPRDAETDT